MAENQLSKWLDTKKKDLEKAGGKMNITTGKTQKVLQKEGKNLTQKNTLTDMETFVQISLPNHIWHQKTEIITIGNEI